MDLVHDVEFSPTTANTLAAVTAQGVVLLWDVNNGQVSQRLDTNIVGYHSIAFQPDGLFLAVGGQTEQYEGQIVVLNLSKGSISQTLNTGSAVYDMAFTPDGTLLAVGTVEGKILLYQPGSWTLAGTLTSNGAITTLTSRMNDLGDHLTTVQGRLQNSPALGCQAMFYSQKVTFREWRVLPSHRTDTQLRAAILKATKRSNFGAFHPSNSERYANLRFAYQRCKSNEEKQDMTENYARSEEKKSILSFSFQKLDSMFARRGF